MNRAEQRQATVATKCDEMQMVMAVAVFKSLRHDPKSPTLLDTKRAGHPQNVHRSRDTIGNRAVNAENHGASVTVLSISAHGMFGITEPPPTGLRFAVCMSEFDLLPRARTGSYDVFLLEILR